jgi:quinol monooxygenase YgiN
LLLLICACGPTPIRDLESDVASEQEADPIVVQVKARVNDPAKPFILFFRCLQVKRGTQETFEAVFAKAGEATDIKTGVLAYDPNWDAKDATSCSLYERWKSLADMEATCGRPTLLGGSGELDEMLVRAPELYVLMPFGE